MSFLYNYRQFVKGNEAPENFHMWSAMIVLSSLVSRKVWVPQGYYDIYPNLYVVLVGPPASRKSTAMSIAKQILREVKGVPFSAESTTKEALIREMADNQKVFTDPGTNRAVQYAPMTICVTELSQFLSSSKENMVDFLTTVWDQNYYDYKTKNKGPNGERNEDQIFGPFLNLLACTTPSWISMYLKSDVISGGFSRRAIFVYEERSDKRITFPEITDEAKASWAECLRLAHKIKDLKGVFKWTPDAMAFYDNWYQNLKIPEGHAVVGYHDSKHSLLLKISMLFAVSERQELLMTVKDLQAGLDLLEVTEINLEKVFRGVGRNELAMAISVFQETINRSQGFISDKALRLETITLVNEAEFMQIIDHLRKTEQWFAAEGKDKNGESRVYYMTPQVAKEKKVGPYKPSLGS